MHTVPFRLNLVALAAVVVGVAWSTPCAAQTVSGQASAGQVTVSAIPGTNTTTLSDTGSLGSATDAREASQTTGAIGTLLSGEALHATTIGWPDQVASEASIANLALTVAGSTIGADFVMSRALAVLGQAGAGAVSIDGLSVNGLPIAVTGEPNQTIAIPGGVIVINEQRTSEGRTVVNALHVAVDGAADIVVASATAGIR